MPLFGSATDGVHLLQRFPSRPAPAAWSSSHRRRACPGREGAEHGAGDRVTQFLSYAIPGLPYGCVFALMAVGLVLTYQTSGVFNLAYGAQAYASALVFYVCVQRRLAELGCASSWPSSWWRRCSGSRWTASSTASSARPRCSSSS